MCNLGYCCAEGDGCAVDMKQSVRWFTLAAIKGDAKAQLTLGMLHLTGEAQSREEEEGDDDEIETGIKWLTKAAEQGNMAEAQFKLAQVFDPMAEALKPDMKQAVKWYQMAAEQGHAEAMYVLASLYATGSDDGELEKDESEADKWFEKSAKATHQ